MILFFYVCIRVLYLAFCSLFLKFWCYFCLSLCLIAVIIFNSHRLPVMWNKVFVIIDHLCCVHVAEESDDGEKQGRKPPCHTAVDDGNDDDSQPFESSQSLNRRSLSLVGDEVYQYSICCSTRLTGYQEVSHKLIALVTETWDRD